MLEKIKNLQKHSFVNNFRDVRFLGFLIFGILVILASWSGVRVIETNYELQKQISQLDQQNQVEQLQNSNLKLQNDYYNSDTYLELTARKQFSKAAPGEELLLVPKDVALAHAKQLPSDQQQVATTNSTTSSKYQQNLQDWMNFLFRKGS